MVFEALGSDAGVEPGYSKAQRDSLDSDTGFYGSWIISGSVATQTAMPPLNGGLEADLTLRDLYPVGEGVAALVTDFSPGGEAPQAYAPGGAGTLSGGAGALSSNLSARLYSRWTQNIHHTWDGEVWEPVGDPVAPDNGPPPDVLVDVASGTFGMFYSYQETFVFLDSDDGLDWEVPEWTIDISLPAGNKVEVQRVDGKIIVVFHPTDDQGDYRAFGMTPDEDSGDAEVEEIDLDPAPPTIDWIDEDPDPAFPDLQSSAALLWWFGPGTDLEEAAWLVGDWLETLSAN